MVDRMFCRNISVFTKVLPSCLVKPTMFKLLFILFVTKLYARINIYKNRSRRCDIIRPRRKGPPVINPEPVKPQLCMRVVLWYYIRSFKKYKNSNQGHKIFFMTSSYLKTVIEVKYFFE